MSARKPTVAVDLDGTIAVYDRWRGLEHIGDPIPGAKEFLTALREFAIVLIWTTRCNPEVEDRPEGVTADTLGRIVRGWLDQHGLPYDDVYTGPVKPLAACFLDDRAVSCRPMDFKPSARSGGDFGTDDHYAHVVLRAKTLCGVAVKQDKPVGQPPPGELFAPSSDVSPLKR